MAHEVHGRRVVVAGAARSGVAAAALLASRGAHVTLSEIRASAAAAAGLPPGVRLELGGHRLETFTSADLVVLSPGVPPDQPAIRAARARGIPVVGEMELASWWLRGRIVAITGTKGKSTTTALSGRILQAGGFAVTIGGNIGEPLSSQVGASRPDMLHVVEASSFQLEQIETFHPWIAVLLNFSPDHLDRHRTVEEYGRAKARIFENQTDGDWAVVNADDPAALQLARTRARRVLFARDAPLADGVVAERGWIVERRGGASEPLVPLEAVRLPGRHLLADVIAAAAVGRIAGVDAQAMTAAIEGFEGLEHVMEPVAEIAGVRFVNDSKATNVASARMAIESFESGLVPIIGGRFKGGELALLAEPLGRRARAVVAIGEARTLVAQALEGAVPVHPADSFEAAIAEAFELARPDGIVLLAPACASFDMFGDYAERGRRFKEIVRGLAARLEPERAATGRDRG